LQATILAAGGTYVEWQASRMPGFSSANELVRLQRILGATRPDIVHLHSSAAGLIGRLLIRRRLPTLFQPHGWSFQAMQGFGRRGALVWERLAARWADAIVCVSEGERQAAAAVGVRARWQIIRNGVDEDFLSNGSSEEKEEARTRLGVPGRVPVAVCVGRLSYAKGQDVLVDAWQRVRMNIPEARLFLVGAGPDREQLQQASGPGIEFVGHREDVREWLDASDVVAIPSRWEGMSLSMLEAMARGRSIVSTDVGGARETVGRGSGVIVDRTPEALAAALMERLKQPALAAEEGRAGRSLVEASHRAEMTFDAVCSCYIEVMAAGDPFSRLGR
jgi:glycosyltransferase involved in cell wall biosynthesis